MFQHDGHWEDHPTFTGTDAVPIRHRWHGNHGNQLHQGAVAHSAHIPEMPMRPRRIRSEGPWFLAPRSTPEAALVKLREPLQPDQAMQEPMLEHQSQEVQAHHRPIGADVHHQVQGLGQPGPGAWIGQSQELPECALGAVPKSLRHTIAYSNLNGQEQIQETRVTCSGDDCETMSNNVMPQIIRVRPSGSKEAKHRMCSGSPTLMWDSMDHMAHRVANSARWLLGYAPEPGNQGNQQEEASGQLSGQPLRSEGVMKVYSYFNNNGHEEMKQVESHCKDGACVQRSRTFAPNPSVPKEPKDAHDVRHAMSAYEA